MDKVLLDNLKERLADLADEPMLRKAWVDVAFFFPSYGELVCMIFDDTGLSNIIENGTLEAEFGPRAAQLITTLHRLTTAIDDDLRADAILEDPTFKALQQTARELLVELSK